MPVANIGFSDIDFTEYDWYTPVLELARGRMVDQPKRMVHFEHDDKWYWAWVVNINEPEVWRTDKFRDMKNLLKAYNWVDDWGMSNLMRIDYMKFIMDDMRRWEN